MNASSRQGQAKRARVAEAGVAYIPRRIRSINGGSAADRGGAYVPRRMSVPHQQVRRVASRPRRGPRLVDALLLLVLALVEIPVAIEEKRPPSINLFKRVPHVLKSLARLTWAIRVAKRS